MPERENKSPEDEPMPVIEGLYMRRFSNVKVQKAS